jgi:leader peptidase (prepilin peptidase)/N-methyltransferase
LIVETLFIHLIVFILGTFIGSFLNVLIFRHNTGKTILGRSGCMSCRARLKWFELVPIVNFFILRGRCRSCRSPLSAQYPIVEIATGFLFLIAFLISETLLAAMFNALVFSILIVIVAYDMRHKIIPDAYVWSFVALAFLSLFFDFSTLSLTVPTLLSLVSGIVTALPLFVLWLVSRGAWIGLGDSKIALGTGTILGLSGGLVALMYAFWIGAIVGITLMLIERLRTGCVLNKGGKALTMKSEIPFAPFLILGFFIVYLLPDVFFEPIRVLYTFQ